MIYHSLLGNTRYELDDNEINIKISRINQQGITDIWIPRSLIVQYIATELRKFHGIEAEQRLSSFIRFLQG